MLLFFCLTAMTVSAANYEVSSPNGKVKVTVNTDAAVKWSVDYDGRQVLLPSTIDIRLVQGKKTVGLGTVGKVAKCSVNSSFKNPFYKRLTVSDEYGGSCCSIPPRSSPSRCAPITMGLPIV